MSFNPLAQRIVKQIQVPPEGSVCELGNQTMDVKGGQTSAEDFYKVLGWKTYVSLDISDKWGSKITDLNHPLEDDSLANKFHLVTNNGTGEHLFDQASAFRNVHWLTAPGGIMLHILPWHNWTNHGFYNFHPILFRDLVAANGYDLLGLYAGERNGHLQRLGEEAFYHPKSFKEPLTNIERVLRGFGERTNVSIVAMLRKVKDEPFRYPVQGKYAEDFASDTMKTAYSTTQRLVPEEAVPFVLPNDYTVETDPFPHIIVKNALPQDYYDQLLKAWPEWDEIAPEAEQNTLHQWQASKVIGDSGIQPIWRQFFQVHTGIDWFNILLDAFGPHVQDLMQKVPREFTLGVRGTGPFDIQMDCQFAVNTPVTELSRVRGPHIDSPDQIIGGLFYMPVPGDRQGGDLKLCRLIEPEPELIGKAEVKFGDCELAKIIPYEPNTLILFVNTLNAVHGVGDRQPGPHPRRYINFLVNSKTPVRGEWLQDTEADQSELREVHRR